MPLKRVKARLAANGTFIIIFNMRRPLSCFLSVPGRKKPLPIRQSGRVAPPLIYTLYIIGVLSYFRTPKRGESRHEKRRIFPRLKKKPCLECKQALFALQRSLVYRQKKPCLQTHLKTSVFQCRRNASPTLPPRVIQPAATDAAPTLSEGAAE